MKQCHQKEQIISFYVVIKMPLIFARHPINEMSEIPDQYRRNHYYLVTMIIKRSLLSNGISQSYHSSIIPTSIIEITNWIHHIGEMSEIPVHYIWSHVELTVGF